MESWKHDELLRDLKSHVEKTGINGSRMVWTDIPMGKGGSQRPDLFSLEKSFSKPNPTAYEIKVSRSDFLQDVTAGKWTGYKQFASRVIFCVPKGLIKKTEVPDGAGLMVRSEKGWRNVKRATVSGKLPEFDHMLKLLLKTDEAARITKRSLDINYYRISKEVSKKHGEEIGKIISNIGEAKYKIQAAEERAEMIISRANGIKECAESRAKDDRERYMEDYEEVLSETRDALSLSPEASRFEVLSAMRKIINKLNGVNVGKMNLLTKLSLQAGNFKMDLDTAANQIEEMEKRAMEKE